MEKMKHELTPCTNSDFIKKPVRKLTSCRMCKSTKLYEFLDLGYAPPSDALLSKSHLDEEEILFPLRVVQCEECGLTQLSHAVIPEQLYGEKYLYESSITEMGKKHFFDMADTICKKLELKKGSLVIDIGSNVGVLLEKFKLNGMNILGIDPAPKICKKANERGIETWENFMSSKIAKKIVEKKGKAKVITGTNVFAHIDDKEDLMKAIDLLLDDDGVFIVEAPYLVDLIEKLEYDTIYLEHLEYLSVKPLINFFNKYSLDLFDIGRYEIHGNSLRYFICRKGKRKISPEVKKLLNYENEMKIYEKSTLDNFSKKVFEHRKSLIELLLKLKKEGHSIVGISAPAKGNTLLNYCKIGPEILDYITEKSIIKRNKYTPGMHIPIVEEERLLIDKPKYGLILAWNFNKEIMKNNESFKRVGGKFIIPIPEPIII